MPQHSDKSVFTRFQTFSLLKCAQIQRYTASSTSPVPLGPAAELPGHGQGFVGLKFEPGVLDHDPRTAASSATVASSMASASLQSGRAAVRQRVGGRIHRLQRAAP